MYLKRDKEIKECEPLKIIAEFEDAKQDIAAIPPPNKSG